MCLQQCNSLAWTCWRSAVTRLIHEVSFTCTMHCEAFANIMWSLNWKTIQIPVRNTAYLNSSSKYELFLNLSKLLFRSIIIFYITSIKFPNRLITSVILQISQYAPCMIKVDSEAITWDVICFDGWSFNSINRYSVSQINNFPDSCS